MEFFRAKNIAVDNCYKLNPYCYRINIAGSVRRLAPEVKDIEIICLPKYEEIESADLFGGVTITRVLSKEFSTLFYSLGEVIKGKPEGRYAQIKLSEGIMLDLFMPEPSDYFRQYAIRTGSAEYSNYVIAYGWKKLGWVGTDQGLRRQTQCIEKKLPDGKSKWIPKSDKVDKPPVWESEESFFKWLGVMYRNPKDRVM